MRHRLLLEAPRLRNEHSRAIGCVGRKILPAVLAGNRLPIHNALDELEGFVVPDGREKYDFYNDLIILALSSKISALEDRKNIADICKYGRHGRINRGFYSA